MLAELSRADFEEVVVGKKTKSQARRDRKRKLRRAKNEKVKDKRAGAIIQVYDVVVVDPPWPMQKMERECRPNETKELDYPTMSELEIRGLKIPASVDCHLFLWTTQRFLPMAFGVMEHWGFRYVCCFVWHKPGGPQPFGLPQYNAEFAIYGRKGKPEFSCTKAFPVCFEARRGKHSEKPDEFYEMIRRSTDGQRIDMFGRHRHSGFDSWGKEAQ